MQELPDRRGENIWIPEPRLFLPVDRDRIAVPAASRLDDHARGEDRGVEMRGAVIDRPSWQGSWSPLSGR